MDKPLKSILISRIPSRSKQRNLAIGIRHYVLKGGILCVVSGKGPSHFFIETAVRARKQAIAIVRDKEYYGLDNGQWSHALPIIPGPKENHAFVLDTFDSLGKKHFKNWEMYSRNADKFRWQYWHGDLLLLL